MKYRNIFLKIHFGLLIVIFLNFIVRQLTDFSISSYILFVIKISVYSSGLILFFLTIKPFQKKAIYFAVYLFSPLGVLLSWFMDGIFGALIASLFMWAITVDNYIIKDNNYKITQQFSGFFGACCKYNVKKNYFYIVEKDLGQFSLEDEGLSLKTFTVSENEQKLNLKYIFQDINYKAKNVDTTLILLTKSNNE